MDDQDIIGLVSGTLNFLLITNEFFSRSFCKYNGEQTRGLLSKNREFDNIIWSISAFVALGLSVTLSLTTFSESTCPDGFYAAG